MSSDLSVDRISNLPRNVIDAILSFLPIRDAVGTSILSRGWRYEWSNLSHLLFDKHCFELPKDQTQVEFDDKLVKIIDRVLLLHCGRVHKFRLSTELASCIDIDRWILFLSRNGIKEFTLDKWKGEVYKLPSSLFSCVELTYLELYRCRFNIPDWFKGFSNLTVIDLQCVSFSEKALQTLISGSPLLNKLVLRHIDGCARLKICAQKLVDLSVEGEFEDICFGSTPLLATASIKLLNSADGGALANGAECNLIRILGCLPSLERLELLAQTLRILAVGDVPMRLPDASQLKYLTININFEDIQEMLTALCLFRSSPILQKLDLKAISDQTTARISIEDFWEARENFSCLFGCLRSVRVSDFTGNNSELGFIQFVLENAPVLEELQIGVKENTFDELKILRQLVKFRRRSAKAEISFLA